MDSAEKLTNLTEVLAEIRSREQNANDDFDDRWDIPNLRVLASSVGATESQILEAQMRGVLANTFISAGEKDATLAKLADELEITRASQVD